jgi:stage V sporulation protein B
MSESSKKQNFLQGAAWLAMATAIVKVIGALYKIPLKMVIGDQGYSYFYTAYEIYTVLLLLSTAGLPVAMSRMVSQAHALGHNNQVRRIYTTARTIFLTLGGISTALMLLFCHQLADFQRQPDAWFAILCLSPCALLTCRLSSYRGFFQGQGNMRPTSVSQILEAVCKLLVGLGAAILLAKVTGSVAFAAGGAILGVTFSCLFSAVFLLSKFRPAYNALPQTHEKVDSFGTTTKRLLAFAIPITIGSVGLQILTVLETRLYMGQLLGSLAMEQDAAETVKGIYNMCQTVFNMPCSFIVPITISIIPAITSHLTLDNGMAAKTTAESAARITGLISLPCAVGLAVLAKPVMSLLGGYSGEKAVLAGQLMALLGICVFLYAVVQFTNAVLQANGFANLPVVNMLICGTMKLLVVFILVGNPALGIAGAPIGALVCYFCIGALNIFSIRRVVKEKPALVMNLLRPLIPALLMGGAVFGTYQGLLWLLGEGTSNIILCGGPIMVGVVIYALSVVVFKTITREDCLLLPKGEKIAKLMGL